MFLRGRGIGASNSTSSSASSVPSGAISTSAAVCANVSAPPEMSASMSVVAPGGRSIPVNVAAGVRSMSRPSRSTPSRIPALSRNVASRIILISISLRHSLARSFISPATRPSAHGSRSAPATHCWSLPPAYVNNSTVGVGFGGHHSSAKRYRSRFLPYSATRARIRSRVAAGIWLSVKP